MKILRKIEQIKPGPLTTIQSLCKILKEKNAIR